MDDLAGFLKRLEKEKLRFFVEPLSFARDGTKVYVQAFNQYWEVVFYPGDPVEVTIFESTRVEPDGYSAIEGLFDQAAKAWIAAAEDLKIEFITPFSFRDDQGNTHRCAGLLKYFGSSNGTVVVSHKDSDDVHDAAEACGFFTPSLNPFWYNKYNRERYIKALNDWGWFGPELEKPVWLSSTDQ